MIRALENNTLGLVLASICGALLLATLGLAVMSALPPSADATPGDEAEADISADIASLQSARPVEEYAEIGQRPVFNEDRRPAPVLADDGGDDTELPVEDIGAPDVELAGVVITPTLRMATLRSRESEHSLVAFEGEPLEGDFGTWQVSRIDERMVTLASADGEELQLELQVHDAVIRQPPESKRGGEPESDAVAEAGGESGEEEGLSDPSEAMSRAEQIRQRIEERREELRRAADDRDSEQAQNYRDAIQSMINQRNEDRAQQQQQQAAEDEGQ